jgi:hypothetical protein
LGHGPAYDALMHRNGQLNVKRGRQSVLTRARRRAIVRLLSQGTSRNRAAQIIGCAPSTITYGALRDPRFGRAIAQARAAHLRRLSDTMLAAIATPRSSPLGAQVQHPPSRERQPTRAPHPRAPGSAGRASTAPPVNPFAELFRLLQSPPPAAQPAPPPHSTTQNRPSNIRAEIAADFERTAAAPLALERLLAAVRGSPRGTPGAPLGFAIE